MRPLLVLNVVGLTPALLGEATPRLARLAGSGFQAELGTVLPAVTCPAQSTILTGLLPKDHGIVGNGWYFRDLAEVWLWRQSNRLVEGKKVWEMGRERDRSFTCAKVFWWYNMYSSADWSLTPRPVYPADGRKISGLYSKPAALKEAIESELGPFPLFDFWGPRAGIRSSAWIARAARSIIERHRPTLTLVYLPHLDYDLQRFGPDSPALGEQLRAIDGVAGDLMDFALERDMKVMVLSEYGITSVRSSISPNRILRRAGFLSVQKALDWELLDPGASRAFAVSDHQVAHVYVERPEDIDPVRRLLESVEGIDRVLDRDGQATFGLDHPRSGELVLVAKKDRWFDYYYWLDDRLAPDFAPTVDIHRKPGYDPAELFLDPARRMVKLKIAWKLLKKALGFRYLMDVIPIESSLVRGSHGRLPDRPAEGPVLLSSSKREQTSRLEMTEVAGVLLETIFGG
jgi:predicted AlkP superfamily pyrophosphatase or phosphodiesterase